MKKSSPPLANKMQTNGHNFLKDGPIQIPYRDSDSSGIQQIMWGQNGQLRKRSCDAFLIQKEDYCFYYFVTSEFFIIGNIWKQE